VPGRAHSQVAARKQEKRDPKCQENEPQSSVQAKGRDPHIKRENTPQQKRYSDPGGMWGLEPASAHGPEQQCVPPPERAVGYERNCSKRVAVPVFQHSRDNLGQPSIAVGQRDHDTCSFRWKKAGIHAAQHHRGKSEAGQSQGSRICRLPIRHRSSATLNRMILKQTAKLIQL
jgi:cytolysin (calcineurin-like family phosphatase)